ncbi:unnamed protein product [Ambrosiozyma monospora]|uniref:Unnamed protein product n=1 Tax=Ambrosiozyma monospora TaxID=43982 RepID=A0A9W6YR29_AMBMO|nr:unnamed protein product [Ambrosiozyma monospora]
MSYFIKFTNFISPHFTNMLAGYEMEPVSNETRSPKVKSPVGSVEDSDTRNTSDQATNTVFETDESTDFHDIISTSVSELYKKPVRETLSGAPFPSETETETIEELMNDRNQSSAASIDGSTEETSSNSDFDNEEGTYSTSDTNSVSLDSNKFPHTKMLPAPSMQILDEQANDDNSSDGTFTFSFGWKVIKKLALFLSEHWEICTYKLKRWWASTPTQDEPKEQKDDSNLEYFESAIWLFVVSEDNSGLDDGTLEVMSDARDTFHCQKFQSVEQICIGFCGASPRRYLGLNAIVVANHRSGFGIICCPPAPACYHKRLGNISPFFTFSHES